MMLRTNRSVTIPVFTFMLQQEEIPPTCHFCAREQETPSIFFFGESVRNQNRSLKTGEHAPEKHPQIMSFMSNLKQAMHCRISLTLKRDLCEEKNNIKR